MDIYLFIVDNIMWFIIISCLYSDISELSYGQTDCL